MPKHERAVSDLDDGKSKCARHHTAEEREISCVTIQRFWTHKLAVEATKYGMTSEIAKALPFVDLLSDLRDTTKINVMKCIVQRIYSLTATAGRFDIQENKIVNIRVFLAAFMIAYHPAQVFERTTKLEVALCEAAVNMLKVFDVMCTDIANSTRGSCLRETCEHLPTCASRVPRRISSMEASRRSQAHRAHPTRIGCSSGSTRASNRKRCRHAQIPHRICCTANAAPFEAVANRGG